MKSTTKVSLLLVFTLLAALLAPALAQAATVKLTVSKSGTGSGTVTSSPIGINCGATCSANFTKNASVNLTAAASAGSTFSGWSGACTGTTGTCTVTMNVAKTVTASFTPVPVQLTVTKAGTGTGTVTSSPAGINCGITCAANFNQNSAVTLTEAAAAGSVFSGWSGACTGTASTCTVTLSLAKTVTASFTPVPVQLTVSKTGTGTGTVTSSPAGIDCGVTCAANFNQNSTVTLTATAATGSTFVGWSGVCTGTAATCTVTMSQAQAVTAGFTPLQLTLSIAKIGTGSGTITSSPVGIDCGISCNGSYNWNTLVTLTAIPATGSTFNGWSGACTGTATTCTVTMNQAQNVTAGFTPLQLTLSVAKTGTGSGTITGSPVGIDCGISCNGSYDWNTPVTLAATPTTGSTFNGWSGACTGTATTCTVTMSQAQNVTAGFTPLQLTLSVTKTGTGNGTITGTPVGIDCGISCSGAYDWNTLITLTATPTTGSTFNGWSGACTGAATTCTVTMNQSQNLTADYALTLKTLSIDKTGSGTGTITSSPPGIDCGATCSAAYLPGTLVTLTATPATGSTFGGWFGACTGTATTCTATLSQAQSVSSTFSAPAVTTYQYDPNGNLTQVTDPLGGVRQYQFNALNQAVLQLEPHPTAIGSTLGQISTTYDSLGQVTSVTDPRHLTTSYNVDSLGNLLKQTSPDTGITNSSHDEAGNLKTRTDARGKIANYSYDSLNRITQIAYDDQTVTYSWDNCANGINRLCSLANNNSSLSYGYDSHGRITSKTQSAGTTPLTVSHTYNTAGQRVNSLSPGGQAVEYQWTSNRITALYINGQPLITQITYEPDGQINGWTWSNNQLAERFYDLNGRPVIVSMGFDAPTQLADNRNYGYDAAGRLVNAIDDIDPTLNQRHDYDGLDHLTGSQRGEPALSLINYSYDLNGNRLSKVLDNTNQSNYNTDAASNQLQSQSGAQTLSYNYDPAGNLISDGTFSYNYNAAGRHITATAAGQTSNYGYDAIGQRVTKTVAGTTTQYFYDEHGHLTGEYDATGQLIQEIIWLGDLPVAALKPTTPASATTNIYYIHADHLGTPRKITRPGDNKVLWTWESEAFGNSLPNQNPSGLGNFVFNLRFPGQYYDAETGLHYNMARYYNPKTGGYDQSDPIGLRGGINTYTYVGGNPVNAVDPLGLDSLVLYGMGISSNPAGHSALAFTDQGIYSYGTSQPFGSSVTDYIKDQSSYRDTIAVVLKTTPQQEKTMIDTMKSASGSKYDLFKNNCATTNKKALDSAGISSPIPVIPFLPITMRDIGWAQPGSTSYFIPQGGTLPSQLEQFNPHQ